MIFQPPTHGSVYVSWIAPPDSWAARIWVPVRMSYMISVLPVSSVRGKMSSAVPLKQLMALNEQRTQWLSWHFLMSFDHEVWAVPFFLSETHIHLRTFEGLKTEFTGVLIRDDEMILKANLCRGNPRIKHRLWGAYSNSQKDRNNKRVANPFSIWRYTFLAVCQFDCGLFWTCRQSALYLM